MTGFGYNVLGFGFREEVASGGSPFSRAVFGGGGFGATDVMQYFDIVTTGNAVDFGDLTGASYNVSVVSNATRGIFGGGNIDSAISNVMQYITIASTGNTSDFGDINQAINDMAQGSINSTTRGIWAGGYVASGINSGMTYITIASTGNTIGFGALNSLAYRGYKAGGLSSTTRGIICGGGDASNGSNSMIEYCTIAGGGDTTDFGDLSTPREPGGCGDSVRGIMHSGYTGSAFVDTIDYITIASTGDSTDFGDLSNGSRDTSSASNPTRSVIAIGKASYAYNSNTLEFVTNATTGNSSDLGDLTDDKGARAGLSSANGGSGF